MFLRLCDEFTVTPALSSTECIGGFGRLSTGALRSQGEQLLSAEYPDTEESRFHAASLAASELLVKKL